MATPTAAAPAFTGFRPEAIQFLADLAANNDRAWFQPRKADFERLLRDPLVALIAALGERFEARGIPLRADPTRSPFRIYRDTRFSKDKSPYKTNVGASFPWVEATTGPDGPIGVTERHGPGGYFHLQPGEIYVGGGMWHPEPAQLASFRRAVVDERARVHATFEEPGFLAAFDGISDDGESLKRVPAGFSADDPDADWLRLKNVVFGKRLSDADAASPALPDILADAFAAGLPVMRFIASL
jgi:uncharacterized protein (TIGR02453 family)